MRRMVVFAVAVGSVLGVLGLLAPAARSQPDDKRDGSLKVCCGGSVGYIGGSGSISGNIVGPAGRTSKAPSQPKSVAPAPQVEQPSATTGGAVADFELPLPVEAEPVSRATADPVVFWAAIAGLLGAGALIFFRGRAPAG